MIEYFERIRKCQKKHDTKVHTYTQYKIYFGKASMPILFGKNKSVSNIHCVFTMCARQHTKYFMYAISLNLQNKPMGYNYYSYPCFVEMKIEAETVEITFQDQEGSKWQNWD